MRSTSMIWGCCLVFLLLGYVQNNAIELLSCKYSIDGLKSFENLGSLRLTHSNGAVSLAKDKVEDISERSYRKLFRVKDGFYCVDCQLQNENKTNYSTCVEISHLINVQFQFSLVGHFSDIHNLTLVAISLVPKLRNTQSNSRGRMNLEVKASIPEQLPVIKLKNYNEAYKRVNQKSAQDDERPFYLKYWYLFVIPLVVALLIPK